MSEMIGLKKIDQDEEWEEAQSEERGYRLEWDEPFLTRTKETCFFPKTLRHWATSSFQCDENGPLISRGAENRYSLPVFFPSINIGLTFGLNLLGSLFFILKTHDVASSCSSTWSNRVCLLRPQMLLKAEMFSTDLGLISVKFFTTVPPSRVISFIEIQLLHDSPEMACICNCWKCAFLFVDMGKMETYRFGEVINEGNKQFSR